MRPAGILALFCLLVAGAHAADSDGLAGKSWELTSLAGRSQPKGATLQFTTSGKVSGFAGCNDFSGSYTVSGRSISISKNLAMTMRACASPVMKAEQAYVDALTSARRFSVSGETLKLKSRIGRTLATFGAGSQGLAGTSWVVTGYNNGKQAVVSVMQGTKVTASFTGGSVSGSAGCNTYEGPVASTPPKISIGPVVSTRKFCPTPEGVMGQESAFFAALQSAATYHLSGDQLELRAADGAIAVTMQRARSG